jgi:hypothetical protein
MPFASADSGSGSCNAGMLAPILPQSHMLIYSNAISP